MQRGQRSKLGRSPVRLRKLGAQARCGLGNTHQKTVAAGLKKEKCSTYLHAGRITKKGKQTTDTPCLRKTAQTSRSLYIAQRKVCRERMRELGEKAGYIRLQDLCIAVGERAEKEAGLNNWTKPPSKVKGNDSGQGGKAVLNHCANV